MGIPKPPAILDQLINGRRWDASSVEATFHTITTKNWTDLSYEHSLTPGILRGADARKLGRTRGEYEATASFTMYKSDVYALLATLAGNYMETVFNITVVMAEPGTLAVTDFIEGCRITSLSASASSGGDALMMDVEVDVMDIQLNGMSATGGNSGAAGSLAAAAGALGNL